MTQPGDPHVPEFQLPDTPVPARRKTVLDWIEWAGNKLPEPAILFAVLAALVVLASGIGAAVGWKVQPLQLKPVMVQAVAADGTPKVNADGSPKMVPKKDERGKYVTELVEVGSALQPRSLMTSEGVYWALSSMIRNFTGLPALGLVFTGMLGIGLAEKFGLFGALMRWLAMLTPKKLLTPMIVFIGANSSVASDAGYIILPPLASALYLAMGRHPIAGLAASFAGVAGGFGGGFFPTAADGFLAGVATQAAHIIDPSYKDVLATHNWYFKMGSAIVVMFAGWYVTDKIVEPRLKREGVRDASRTEVAESAKTLEELRLKPVEKRGLLWAGVVHVAVLAVFAALVMVPGWPLHGQGVPRLASGQVPTSTPIRVETKADHTAVPAGEVMFRQADVLKKSPDGTAALDAQGKPVVLEPGYTVAQEGRSTMLERPGDRWSQVIVPLILFAFLLPGMAYGRVVGTLRSQKDFIEGIYHGIRTIVPVLTIAFFMGQFVNYFTYTGLDRMLAFAGGGLLVQVDLPTPVLIVLFVALVVAGDFALSGMLSKYAVMAPIFIPMFMMVGMSPELTTAAYRIGDSVVNIITPLNSYLLIILVVLQKYKKDAGLGSLISLMLPYSVLFFAVWTGFLLLWYASGLELGPGSPLGYSPAP